MKFFFWSTQHGLVDGVHLDKISDAVDECEVQNYPIISRVIQWFNEFREKKGSLAYVGIINIDKITASRVFPGFNSSHTLAQPFSQATAYPFNTVLDGPHNKLVVHGRPRYFQAPFTQRVCAVHAQSKSLFCNVMCPLVVVGSGQKVFYIWKSDTEEKAH